MLKIKDVSSLISPDILNSLSNLLIEEGKLELEITNESIIKNIITNLKFGGYNKIINLDNKISAIKKNKTIKNQWKSIKLEDKCEKVLEDELIDPYDSYQKFSKETDCISKPKPCKNCNCGRAEKENLQQKQEEQKKLDPNFKPSCGKCYLGDAFRCSGCPFRGQPAFEPGDKIQFNSGNINDSKLEEENIIVNLKDSKIKIDIW